MPLAAVAIQMGRKTQAESNEVRRPASLRPLWPHSAGVGDWGICLGLFESSQDDLYFAFLACFPLFREFRPPGRGSVGHLGCVEVR